MAQDIPSPAEALADMQRSAERSGRLYGYTLGAPYLFIAGAAWLAADLLYQLTAFGKWSWPVVSLAATVLCIGVAVRQSVRRSAQERSPKLDAWFWKGMALWVMIAAFVFATVSIFAPFSGVQIHSYTGVVSGMVYAVLGLFAGSRLLVTGLGVAALSLAGHFLVQDYYALYMGLVCGGGMMLAALWLRRV